MEGESSNLILRETIVAQDSQGNVCLHDLWLLAGSPENLRARDWRRYKSAEGVISALGRRSVGITHTSQEEAEESIFYTAGKGRGARTFAHPVVALAYAEALNHDLAIEVRELFLRFMAHDVSLFDEFMQTWSAQQATEAARLQAREKLTETERRFQGTLYQHNVDGPGIGRVRSKGDAVLFDGRDTEAMKDKWNVPEGRPLADFAPEVVIVAKQLGAAITTHNVRTNNLRGEGTITHEHMTNNKTVRGTLVSRGIKPELLAPEEDLKKVERRHSIDAKKLSGPVRQPRKKKPG